MVAGYALINNVEEYAETYFERLTSKGLIYMQSVFSPVIIM
jgi:hypothetical protein